MSTTPALTRTALAASEHVLLIGGRLLKEGVLVENRQLAVGDADGACAASYELFDEDVIVAGMTDIHTHLQAGGSYVNGLTLEEVAAEGVEVAADAGTYGPESMGDALKSLQSEALSDQIVCRFWTHLYGTGIHDGRDIEEFGDILGPIQELFAGECGPSVVGIKIRLGLNPPLGDEHLFSSALAAAEAVDRPLMIHQTNSAIPVPSLYSRLRPGDMVTHAFQGRGGCIVDEQGKLEPEVAEAWERGVVFDIGHGRNHFAWRVFDACLQVGVIPHTISTDMTKPSYLEEPIVDLGFVMSKMIAAGLDEATAFSLISEAPQRLLGIAPSFERRATVLRAEAYGEESNDAEGEARLIARRWRPIISLAAAR